MNSSYSIIISRVGTSWNQSQVHVIHCFKIKYKKWDFIFKQRIVVFCFFLAVKLQNDEKRSKKGGNKLSWGKKKNDRFVNITSPLTKRVKLTFFLDWATKTTWETAWSDRKVSKSTYSSTCAAPFFISSI